MLGLLLKEQLNKNKIENDKMAEEEKKEEEEIVNEIKSGFTKIAKGFNEIKKLENQMYYNLKINDAKFALQIVIDDLNKHLSINIPNIERN